MRHIYYTHAWYRRAGWEEPKRETEIQQRRAAAHHVNGGQIRQSERIDFIQCHHPALGTNAERVWLKLGKVDPHKLAQFSISKGPLDPFGLRGGSSIRELSTEFLYQNKASSTRRTCSPLVARPHVYVTLCAPDSENQPSQYPVSHEGKPPCVHLRCVYLLPINTSLDLILLSEFYGKYQSLQSSKHQNCTLSLTGSSGKWPGRLIRP